MGRYNLDSLDPRAKMVITLIVSCGAFLIRDMICMVMLTAVIFCLLLLAGVRLRQQGRQLKGILGMAALVFVLQCMVGRLEGGALLALRLLILAESALLLLTSPLRDYLLALVQWKVPYELAYMIVLAFRFFPILRREALDVSYSMQLRGMDLKKASLGRRFRAYGMMCGPVLWGAMERAKDTAVAMEARGFRSAPQRTYMRKLKFKKKDFAAMAAVLLVTAGLATFSRWNTSAAKTEPQELGMQVILSQREKNSLTVSWSDTALYEGSLQWGEDTVSAEVACIRENSYYRYQADVPELEEGKTYLYTVGSAKERSVQGSYTCRAESEDFSFLYMGDVQYSLRDRDYEIWGETLKAAYERHGDIRFGMFGGDMVENGADSKDWEAFLENAESVFSQIPMMTAVGNHETSIYPKTYEKVMSLPENSPLKEECYSFDYGACHFLVLNSCLFMEERMEQEGYEQIIKEVNQWIRQDLRESTAPWKIVVMHHPLYPVVEDDEIYQRIRGNWEEIFDEERVDLLLCGHQHVYMRTEPIHGMVAVMANSGEKRSYYLEEGAVPEEYVKVLQEETSNYVLIEVTRDGMEMTAYSKEGEELDHYQWKKKEMES